MIVMKFGGTSLKNAEMFRKSAEIVLKEPGEKIVVVSAMAGVTDCLINFARQRARGGGRGSWLLLRHSHRILVRKLFPENSDKFQRISEVVEKYFDELDKLGNKVFAHRKFTPRVLDRVMSFGELLSSQIFSAFLWQLGADSNPVMPRLIRTDDNFGRVEIDFAETETNLLLYFSSLLKNKDYIPVVPGFIGTTAKGALTTLGRNGSDYTAAVMANIFEAEELQIWKEVDGVMQADPKLVPEAKVLDNISYSEAMEMSYFGSKVLHPRSILPALQKEIPIRIKNTYNPNFSGTLISLKSNDTPSGVKVISAISDLALINVVGKGMMGVAGIAARVFGATAQAGVNVMMISQASSEYSICFATRKDDATKAVDSIQKEFELEFRRGLLEDVVAVPEISIVAVVGDGMTGKIGVAKEFFIALADAGVNIIAIAQGSSERNISVLIKSEDAEKSVRSVYDAFFK